MIGLNTIYKRTNTGIEILSVSEIEENKLIFTEIISYEELNDLTDEQLELFTLATKQLTKQIKAQIATLE